MNKDGEKAHKNNNTPDTTFAFGCEPVSSVLCFLNTSVSSLALKDTHNTRLES